MVEVLKVQIVSLLSKDDSMYSGFEELIECFLRQNIILICLLQIPLKEVKGELNEYYEIINNPVYRKKYASCKTSTKVLIETFNKAIEIKEKMKSLTYRN